MGESRERLDRQRKICFQSFNHSIIQSFNHSIYIVLTIFLLVTISTVKAQIIIKEKVEIKPGGEDIQSDYPLSSFDPCGSYPTEEYHQVVYSCSMYPIEPYQQLFPFQGGGSNSTFNSNRYYQIEIIEGSDYAYMEKVAYQDSFGVFHPGEYLGSYITGIRGSELSGSGNYIALFDPNNPAIQRAGTYLRENPSLYNIHFNNYEQTEADVTVKITDLDSSVVTYWYTKIVNPELTIANQQLENDTVLHYYSKDVSIKLNNTKFPCLHPGYGGCPPDNVTFNIEITQGQQYGIIKNSETKETNTSFTGLSWEEINHITFTYYANGIQPDSTAIVRIRHSSSDAELTPMEYEFTVKRNTIPPPSEGGAIYIQLDKKQVMPSDTVDIYLRWINELGDALEFVPIQRFQVELAEGSEYGRLVDVESGQEGDNFSDAGRELKLIIENEIQKDLAKITIVAQCDLLIWGGRTPITGSVKIKEREEEATERNKEKEPITPEFIIVGDHLIGVEEVIINKTPIVVEIIPEEISAGDTARIVVKKRQADGTIVEFPAEQQFEIGTLEGCLLGKLSSGGIDTNYINNATQPIYFIADSSADSGLVKIRVGLKDSSTTGNRSNEGRITTEAGEYCFLNAFESVIYKDAEVKVENVIEILLGETKYFGVKKKTATGELKIEEIKTDYGNEPQFPADTDGWEWQKTDVWGDEPVSVVEFDSCGKKMGVYWEKKYPTNNFEKVKIGKKDYYIIKMEELTSGLIRLVGRYWSVDSTYIVKLKAKHTSDSTEVKIIVKRPNKLLSNNQSTSYRRARDVEGKEINIDSLCILFGGKYGIPPQFIKGQMKTESATKIFTFDDGTTGKGFAPSYRYEPFTEQYNDNLKNDVKYNTYFIFDSTYNFSDVPTNHQHLEPINYPNSVKTVWDFIEEYSKLVNSNPTIHIYGGRNASTQRVWFGYQVIDTVYKRIADNIKDGNPTWTDIQVYDSTNNYMIEYLKFQWKNPKSSTANNGTKNNIAQTRVASSYGIAQFLYGTARDIGYPKADLPEGINLISNLELFYKTQKKWLINRLGSVLESSANWPDGYDYSFCRGIYVPKWNSDVDYAKIVINNSRLFLPQK